MKFIAFDFETTGLTLHPEAKLHLQPKAIELAAIEFNEHGQIGDESVWLFNPGESITEEITKITGLTDDDLKDAPTFAESWLDIERFIWGWDAGVAHNYPFDSFILAGELRRMSQTVEWPTLAVCTAQLFEEAWGRRPRLIELYQDVTGEEYEQTHRALDDVRALIRIIKEADLSEAIAAAARSNRIFIPQELRQAA